MKRTLALIIVSLLMCVAFAVGVCAAYQESDIGPYIRFNSQENVDTYFTAGSEVNYAYDAEEGAILYSPRTSSENGLDTNVYFNYGKVVDVSADGYPYYRITYRYVTGDELNVPDGKYEGTDRDARIYYNVSRKTAKAMDDISKTYVADGTRSQFIVGPVTNDATNGGIVESNRFDMPNDAAVNQYYEFYIYDVGFFKTEAAAREYPVATEKSAGANWTFSLTGFKTADGADIAATPVQKTPGDPTAWTVTFPYGTALTAVAPVFSVTSDAAETYQGYANAVYTLQNYDREAVALYEYGEDRSSKRKALTSGVTTVDLTKYTDKTAIFTVIQRGALYEQIELEYTVEEPTDAATVPANVIAGLENMEIEPLLLIGSANQSEAESRMADIINDVLSISGNATVEFIDTTFVAPVSGIENTYAGTPGSFTFKFKATYGDFYAVSDEISVEIPAYTNPDRIILNFSNPAVAGSMNAVDTSMEARIVADDSALGGAYMHVEKLNNGSNEFNLCFEQSSVIPKYIDLAKYPVLVIRARAAVADNTQVFYVPESETGYSGTYYKQFTLSAADSNDDVVKGDGTWTTRMVTFDWSSTIKAIRFSFMRNNTTGFEWADIDYIGLFPDKQTAEDFIDNPVLDGDVTDSYADEIEAVNALDGYTAEYSDVVSGVEITNVKSWVRGLVAEALEGYTEGEDYYISFKKHYNAAYNTASAVNNTRNSYTSFTVVFGNNFMNGEFVESDEIVVQLIGGTGIISEMLGAQLRANDGERAIRFGTKVFLSGEIADSVINTETNKFEDLGIVMSDNRTITFGTLITTKDALIARGVTLGNNYFTADAMSLNHLNLTQDGEKWFMGDYEVADVAATNIYEADENSFTYTAVVSGIPDGSESITLVARAYAKITETETGKVTYVYSNPIERSYDLVNNSWSEKTVYDDDCNK